MRAANDNGPFRFDWIGVLIIVAACTIPGGALLAWWFDSWWPLLISAIGAILFMS